MNRWVKTFGEHKIHEQIDVLLQLSTNEYKTTDAASLLERRRFKKAASILKNIIKSIDPELISFEELDGIQNHLSSAIEQIRAFIDTQNVNHLIGGNGDILIALRQLKSYQILSTDVQTVSQVKNVEGELDRFGILVDSKINSFDNALGDLGSRYESISGRLQELESIVESRRAEIDARFSEWQSQFSNAQNDRSRAFDNLYKDLLEKNAAIIDDIDQKATDQIDSDYRSWKEIMDHISKEATEAHASIQRLYNLSAEVSVTGGYVSNAHKEGIAAKIWRRVSIGFIVFAAAWLLYSVFALSSPIYWERVIISFPLTGVLLFGAAYAAQQASRHRDVEVRNRRFALEMAAIDPYLQSLDPADRQALKKELTKNYFGNLGTSADSVALDEKTTKQALELVGQNILKPLGDLFKIMNK